MAPPRIIGLVCIVVGIALLVIGISSSDSFSDQVSKTFTGRYTDATTWYIVGGIAAAALGLFLAVARGGKAAA